MEPEELKAVLDAHKAWMEGKAGGKKAYLRSADLHSADLRSADLRSADLRSADLRSANLTGAYLRCADLRSADLRSAYLSGANLTGAYLRGAYLSGADLSGAYLSGAYLSGADLSGADLSGALIAKGTKIVGLIARLTRIEGPYEFFAWRTDKGDFVEAGCRFMSVADYREHVVKFYVGTSKAAETMDILNFIESRFAATKGE